ncbi:BTAD domain-containing putative transcriptional regulator [Micromonospora sp. NPDC049523]|uniref:ATP-binding protein n=1 Tax=Micromonospora sp. NPDC049523 TaxID=3155921 RepID=UPI00343C0AA3
MVASSPPGSGGGSLRLQILGPLRIWRDGVELDAGPRQQAYLLALLLARAGRPISTSELVDLIWDDDAPATAINIIHKYVGTLRRLLEPGRPARGTGSYLQRSGNGYLFAAGSGVLDVVIFRELVEAARACLADQRHDVALDCYSEALSLWHGPAGDSLAHNSTAMPIFTALNDEFFNACVAAAEVAIAGGQPDRMLQPLQLAARMAPLHENVQASLVSILAGAGQQAQALSVYRTVREQLAEELGIDPGPALRAAHRRVLRQTLPAQDGGLAPECATPPVAGLVGRREESSVLRKAVESALAGGTGIVVVEGEPGVGKTRLLEEVVGEAERRGALVVWGRCLEGDGTPSMWPWVQAVGAVLEGLPVALQEGWRAGELGRLLEPRGGVPGTPVLPDSGARFRLFERVAGVVAQVAMLRPVVLVVDDLQWADVASLQMFGHLAGRLPARALVVGALRDRAPATGSELARMLAAASRVPGHRRIRLGPLGSADVAELVRRETGQIPSAGAVRSIHARTAGNPYFVRELSRLLADGGVLTEEAAARTGVPSTVRDVVRDRMATLDDDARSLLQLAALIGRDVDLGLLARAAGLDVQTCLDRLEPLEALGLFEPTPGDPFSFRFPHDLVRESVARTTQPRWATRLNLRVADALEHTDPVGESVAERLAHHLWAAGPLADPARTAGALVSAGRRATAKSAFEAAERQLHSAAHLARTAGLTELELSALSELTAVVGMRSGYVDSALDLLERAENLARRLGRERAATDFLFSRWAAHSQGLQLDRAGRLARLLRDQGEASDDPIIRAYGLHSWGIHLLDIGNIGEAFRYLSQFSRSLLDDLARRAEHPLRHDLQLLSPVMLALMTALHGDVDGARELLDTLEATAGDDPYAITIWAAFDVTVAAFSGDPVRARRTAERGIAVDKGRSFLFLGSYPRLARCWARAVTGDDPAGAAAEAQEIIAEALLDPPRSGLVTWYVLLAEMMLAAGTPTEAAAALAKAEWCVETYGQRYAEGLLLLLRARLLQAHGEPVAAVRAAAERARTLSAEREVFLFARRAEELLEQLST